MMNEGSWWAKLEEDCVAIPGQLMETNGAVDTIKGLLDPGF